MGRRGSARRSARALRRDRLSSSLLHPSSSPPPPPPQPQTQHITTITQKQKPPTLTLNTLPNKQCSLDFPSFTNGVQSFPPTGRSKASGRISGSATYVTSRRGPAHRFSVAGIVAVGGPTTTDAARYSAWTLGKQRGPSPSGSGPALLARRGLRGGKLVRLRRA